MNLGPLWVRAWALQVAADEATGLSKVMTPGAPTCVADVLRRRLA